MGLNTINILFQEEQVRPSSFGLVFTPIEVSTDGDPTPHSLPTNDGMTSDSNSLYFVLKSRFDKKTFDVRKFI